MLFVFLRPLKIIETEFISTTQKTNFKRTVRLRSVNTMDSVKPPQMNLGLRAEFKAQSGWSQRYRSKVENIIITVY